MLEVLEGGLQTTVQDWPGRQGYLDLGMYPAGPMDMRSFRAANLLVARPRSRSPRAISKSSSPTAAPSRSPAQTCSPRSTGVRRPCGSRSR